MRKKHFLIPGVIFAFVFILAEACRKPEITEPEAYNELYAGGSQTVFDQGSGAFSHEFPVMSQYTGTMHGIGDGAFESPFVTAPAPLRGGVGPVYNNVSCINCHIADGRGKPPEAAEQMLSMLIRISIPGAGPHGEPNAVPGFGGQLQPRSTIGTQPEADVVITHSTINGNFADGMPYTLRAPFYALQNPYIPLPAGVMLSPRIAPPVFGLGLLEAVSEETILGFADPNDADGNGISGKPNVVWDAVAHEMTLGRFGWKCGAPNLLQQSAGAYNEDMGITNYIFPIESSFGQLQYDGLDDENEVQDSVLYYVAMYIRTLGVPARRNLSSPVVKQGKELFMTAKCNSCHIPAMRTGVNVAFPEVSSQVIFPYTDMLLHDMGPGLADNRPEYDADGQEWRTTPLWGLGLTQTVNGHNYFLHDGRARSLQEAILWHGGEAAASQNAFVNMSLGERNALLTFLESL
ncbi:MAG: di-heme oxidoredictase family protein [Bacteroidia bacterium]